MYPCICMKLHTNLYYTSYLLNFCHTCVCMRLLTKTLFPYLFQFRPLYWGRVKLTLELTQESRVKSQDFHLVLAYCFGRELILRLKTNAPLCDLWGWEDSILWWWWWFDVGTLTSCNIHKISLDLESPLMNQSLCIEFLWFRYQCGV